VHDLSPRQDAGLGFGAIEAMVQCVALENRAVRKAALLSGTYSVPSASELTLTYL